MKVLNACDAALLHDFGFKSCWQIENIISYDRWKSFQINRVNRKKERKYKRMWGDLDKGEDKYWNL